MLNKHISSYDAMGIVSVLVCCFAYLTNDNDVRPRLPIDAPSGTDAKAREKSSQLCKSQRKRRTFADNSCDLLWSPKGSQHSSGFFQQSTTRCVVMQSEWKTFHVRQKTAETRNVKWNFKMLSTMPGSRALDSKYGHFSIKSSANPLLMLYQLKASQREIPTGGPNDYL